MEGDETKKKIGIDLDWDKLLPTETAAFPDEEEPPQLVVLPEAKPGLTGTIPIDRNERGNYQTEELGRLSDRDLISTVNSLRLIVDSIVLKLKDGGKKILASLKRHENELERRQRLRLQKDDDGCRKLIPFDIPSCIDTSDSCREGDPPPRLPSQSEFATCFSNRLDENTESRTFNAFEKELSTLNRSEHLMMRSTGNFMSRGRQKRRLSTRETSSQSPRSLSGDFEEQRVSNHAQNGRCFSGRTPCSAGENALGSVAKRLRSSRGQTSSSIRREAQVQGEHVVLVDEEELEAKVMATQENSVGESTNAKIYYPSRDDSEAVEISYSDMECLAPEQYLSSAIMNFYIRYLQGLISPRDGEIGSYHFFNTYFYEKLKEAVARKSVEETSFAKLRRWWKGINIFEKAYVLLPIHESLHWSLVIICMPDKEDKSGPLILHLDSLGLHFSNSIFSNIKRFLIEEWKFLREEVLLDLPIADKVWEKLPRRIDEKAVEVPQQRNDYDCGLFVLFFMKKFIEEAPKRLRKKDNPVFGRRWFKPEEASSLRYEIRSLLMENFKKIQENQNSDS